jgi:hypothetical protein
VNITGDAKKFLKLFVYAVAASLGAAFSGTVTIKLHFHSGGLTRATIGSEGVVDLKK